jgi:hypothetical protein
VSSDGKLNPPDSTKLEVTVAVLKAVVAAAGAVIPVPMLGPILGGVTAEAISFAGQREINRRVDTFLDALARGLEEMHIELDDLKASFWTICVQATDYARRTHLDEKIEMLKNVLLHAASPDVPDSELLSIFIRYAGELTMWHVSFLRCIAAPLEWARLRKYQVQIKTNVDARLIFEGAMRNELPSPELNEVFLQELYARGLAANSANPYAFLSPEAEQLHPHITALGGQFLSFITNYKSDASGL